LSIKTKDGDKVVKLNLDPKEYRLAYKDDVTTIYRKNVSQEEINIVLDSIAQIYINDLLETTK
jgi:hypothetical protein